MASGELRMSHCYFGLRSQGQSLCNESLRCTFLKYFNTHIEFYNNKQDVLRKVVVPIEKIQVVFKLNTSK